MHEEFAKVQSHQVLQSASYIFILFQTLTLKLYKYYDVQTYVETVGLICLCQSSYISSRTSGYISSQTSSYVSFVGRTNLVCSLLPSLPNSFSFCHFLLEKQWKSIWALEDQSVFLAGLEWRGVSLKLDLHCSLWNFYRYKIFSCAIPAGAYKLNTW